MAAEPSVAVVKRWVDGLNSGNLDAALAALAPSYVGHLSAMAEPVRGPEGFRATYMQFIRPAFPDQRIEILKQMAVDGHVAVQIEWTATHKGPFLQIPATGRTVRVPGTGIFRVQDGRILEEWLQEDFLGLWQQLKPPAK